MSKGLLFDIVDETKMLSFGKMLAKACGQSAIIYLHGNLGAGKTTLVRGAIQSFDITSKVKSPTYTLVEEYQFPKCHIFHFDLYRLNHPEELAHIGIEDYFQAEALFFIEWPEKGAGWLPQPDLSCYIDAPNDSRKIRLEANTSKGTEILGQLISE